MCSGDPQNVQGIRYLISRYLWIVIMLCIIFPVVVNADETVQNNVSREMCCKCSCKHCSFKERYSSSLNIIPYVNCNELCRNACPKVPRCGEFVSSTSCGSPKSFSGWWYNPSMPGTGVSIEFDNEGHWFMAWYVYNELGLTGWYTASGNMTDGTNFKGDLLTWKGWPWGGVYKPPVAEKTGFVNGTLIDSEQRQIIINWKIKDKSGTLTLSDFMKDMAQGAGSSRNITGWWYDPAYNGMGFFMEERGGILSLAWYYFREDGSPRWVTSSGSFPVGSSDYRGSLSSWRDGQKPGGSYKKPQEVKGAGEITLTFLSPSRAMAVIDNATTLNLEKFEIDKQDALQGCRENSGPKAIRCGTITIDGNYSDWKSDYRVYVDTDGPDCNDTPGLDLKEVYLAQDKTFFYMRFVLNGPLEESYGYKFGNAYRHIYVYKQDSKAEIFYANAYGWPQPRLPSNFVHMDGNQFECKFYKADVKTYWKDDNNLSAWLGQGVDTECRDYVELPGLDLGF